ncbi:hypothetical protein RHRU231_950030 [Rhodococcus ruber]|uniref:Uncharacterized protein n=1 Tax=Rhodococcus ruber TaxID=1830 RepID=A0A098BVW9_9NOCA|nr:hypothetical protein RHRU231_950030 [Rhodococcus ruber]
MRIRAGRARSGFRRAERIRFDGSGSWRAVTVARVLSAAGANVEKRWHTTRVPPVGSVGWARRPGSTAASRSAH